MFGGNYSLFCDGVQEVHCVLEKDIYLLLLILLVTSRRDSSAPPGRALILDPGVLSLWLLRFDFGHSRRIKGHILYWNYVGIYDPGSSSP